MDIKIWWPLLFVATIILACVMIFPSDLRLADLLGEAGRFEEAIENYQKILTEQPNRGDIRIQLAQLRILNGEPKKALSQFETASQYIELDEIQLSQMYQLYSALGERAKTVTVLEKLVGKAADKTQYLLPLADAYEWNGQTEKAFGLYNQLLAGDPENLRYLNKIIALHVSERNYPESIQHLQTVLKVEPENHDARLLLGSIYIENQQKALAALEFERILRRTPKDSALRTRLAELYLWNEDYQKGILHYERLFMNDVFEDKYFDKLLLLTRDSDPDRAIKYFNYRLNHVPNNTDLRQRFVDLNVHFGFTGEAIKQLNLLIQERPNEPRYRVQLASLYKDTQEPLQAAAVWETLHAAGYFDSTLVEELIPHYQLTKDYDKLATLYASAAGHGFADHDLLSDYAELLTRMRRYEEARSLYSRLLEQDPRDVNARLDLASLHVRMRHEHEAYEILWSGVNDLDIRDEIYLLETTQFFSERNNYREGIVTSERLVDLRPDNLYYNRLALDLLVRTQNYDRAADRYRRLIELAPNDISLKFQLASLYWLQNNVPKTHRTIEEIKREHSNHATLDREIGKFYFERSFLNDATEYLEFALASRPTDAATLRMLGLAHAWNNQPKPAKKILSRYHEIRPDDFYTHYQLGEILRSEGNKGAAAEEFQTALALAQGIPDGRESLLVKGRVYASRNQPTKALREFDKLISLYPDDAGISADYVEGLLTLKNYREAENRIAEILQKNPYNYRALRLQGRSYFEQAKYKEAAATLSTLEQTYGNDLNLKLDLADAQLASGDWMASERSLKNILQQFPATLPAEERLLQLRRQHNQAFATDYKMEEQSNNFLKQAYHVIMSKAVSSLASFKFLFGEETYSSDQPGFQDAEFQNVGLNLNSNFGSKLQTSVTGTAQRHLNQWNLSGTGMLQWKFTPSRTWTVTASANELWRDPFIAALQQGRLDGVQSEISLALTRKLFLWNKLAYERHSISTAERFGEAFRTSVLVGYNWFEKPHLSTYYQYYNLKYDYDNVANRNIIAIPERESVHYVGATLSHQLSRRLYYQLGGSLGRQVQQDNLIYYGSIDLEYMLMRDLRLRSHFTYGSLNQLSGSENIKALKFDLYYFY